MHYHLRGLVLVGRLAEAVRAVLKEQEEGLFCAHSPGVGVQHFAPRQLLRPLPTRGAAGPQEHAVLDQLVHGFGAVDVRSS